MPKVELHVHLDCCLSFEAVSELSPGMTRENYENKFVGPSKCKDLADFLECVGPSISLMQTRKGLLVAVEDLFEQFKQDNVIYGEIRFAPLQHLVMGLTPEEVVLTVEETVTQCVEGTGIEAGIILCTLRHFSEKQSKMTAELVENYRSTRVKALDLAADEAGFPLDAHIRAFKYVSQSLLPATAHAGEAMGAESIRETLDMLKPQRIGHGVRCIEDQQVVQELRDKQVHLEVCPSCNVQIGVFDSFQEHPVNQLYNQGLSIGINTDTRTITNITLSEEYQRLQQEFGWGREHFYHCNQNALKASFLPKNKKEDLLKKLSFGY